MPSQLHRSGAKLRSLPNPPSDPIKDKWQRGCEKQESGQEASTAHSAEAFVQLFTESTRGQSDVSVTPAGLQWRDIKPTHNGNPAANDDLIKLLLASALAATGRYALPRISSFFVFRL